MVHYYRIKDSIHFYYNHKLANGFEKFLYKDFKFIIKRFPTPDDVWDIVNDFRVKNYLKKLPKTKKKIILI